MTTSVRFRRGGSPRSLRKPTRRTPARPSGTRRHQRSHGGRQQRSRAGLFKIVGAVLVVCLLAAAAFLTGALTKVAASTDVAAQILYTAPTANDAAVTLPQSVKADLRKIGLLNETIAVTRVDSTGDIKTTVLDFTPRVNDKLDGPILKVNARAIAAVDKKILKLERDINDEPATSGGRALYVGMLKTNFIKNVPVYIISSGLDLTNPVNTRSLAFEVPPQQVVERVKAVGEVPDLKGNHVVYVLVPTTGAQEELRRPQRDYTKDLWRQLLVSGGGASTVDFIDATGTTPASSVPAPPVPLPALPGTPIAPLTHPDRPQDTVCELSSSTYFAFKTARLIDEPTTKSDLKDCVRKAGKNTMVSLDAWTSYEGPLTATGTPAENPPSEIALSNSRNQTIADLLVDMGIVRRRIVRMTGHGNNNLPYPKDPRSQKNRVCRVTFSPNTTK